MIDIEQRLHDARRAVEAAIAGIDAPTLPHAAPAVPWRRVAAAAAAALVLLVVIGGSGLWIRSQRTTDVAEPDVTATTEITPPADAAAALEGRSRLLANDVRNIQSALLADTEALVTRYDEAVDLVGSAGSAEATARLAEMEGRLAEIERVRDEVVSDLAQLEAEIAEIAVRLATLAGAPDAELRNALETRLNEAESRVDRIRDVRAELASLAGRLDAEIAALRALAATPAAEAITITDHDLGFADRSITDARLAALAADPDRRTLWAVTGLLLDPAGAESAEVLHIEAATGEVLDVIEVPQPMTMIDPLDGMVWIARWGDGGLPDNLIGVIDPATGDVRLWNIGDFSVSAIAGDETGAWLVQGGGWPPEFARFDLASETIGARYPVDVTGPLNDVVVTLGDGGPVAWVADWSGAIVRLDVATGGELSRSVVPGDGVADLQVAAASDDRAGFSVWALDRRGRAYRLGSDGTVIAEFAWDEASCCLTGDPISETTWIVTSQGTLYAGHPAVDPTIVVTLDEVTDAGGDPWIPAATAQTGNSVWIARGPWLTEVRFPQ
jgi:hypothetical protein